MASEPTACTANIGPKGRRQRLTVGLVGMAVSAVATVVLLVSAAPAWLAVLLIVPWWMAALGIFQARAQTCVALAAKGQRDLDSGPEPQPDAERDAIRRQARRVHGQALAFAAAVTGATLIIRGLIAA
jgi:hypothetical protein